MTSPFELKKRPHPLSRRSFLMVAGSAGLAMGFAASAITSSNPLIPPNTPENAGQSLDPSLWFSIDADGFVTVHIIRAEMGQHVGTALARILAEELEVDWAKVRIKHVDSHPKWGFMVTGGSWSVWQTYPVFSRAGAAGRTVLIEAAANLFNVSPIGGRIQNGIVYVGGRSISFGELAKAGVKTREVDETELAALQLKPVDQYQLIGKPVTSLDIPSKTDGTGLYGLDAKIEGMLHGHAIVPPTRNGSQISSIDDSKAKSVKGYIKTLSLDDPSGIVPGWAVVVADSFWAAKQARDLITVKWNAGPGADMTEEKLQAHALSLIKDDNKGVLIDFSDPDPLPEKPAHTLDQIYTTATVLHFQLEPVNALAVPLGDRYEIHTGNQWQSLILPSLAMALGTTEDRITLKSYMLGGGFGRRLNGDYIIPAALAAKAMGKPVKLFLSREDDVRFDCPRSASIQRLQMHFNAEGQIIGMEHRASAGWPSSAIGGETALASTRDGDKYDSFAIAGADHWYEVGPHKVRAVENDLARQTFRPGWLRSVGPGWTNWAVESFMDEAAHHLGKDPVALRLELLTARGKNAGKAPNSVGGALRQANVVRIAADRADWGQELPADTGMGIATSFGQERDMPTWVACVAKVHVNRQTGYVTVQKLTLVTDAGIIVDPDGAAAQTEGAALWGLSIALHEGTEFVNGQVRDLNLGSYTPLRMPDVPEMDLHFIESQQVPVGVGEPMTTVIAPAIANAIYQAVGIRMRHLPIRPEDILAALQEK